VEACDAERMLTTMSEGAEGDAYGGFVFVLEEVRREVAILEGILRENATRGYGSMAIEEKEDKVAPWKVRLEESCRRRDVTTATG